jgi:RHH-type proline utilization regulon transcriptional repressor/proline dehydrogenase/delta 1-pyrroline-5-carboxylate dehydrogenase
MLQGHIERMRSQAHAAFSLELPAALAAQGTFVAPTVLEIGSIRELDREVFGPVLHVVRYRRAELPQLIEDINATGYGLTLGVHSRIDETIDFVADNAHVGNLYVNRNIVGAVVGVQPFGGEGKSGTGPKAGGPLYLHRLRRGSSVATERGATPSPALEALMVWAGAQGRDSLLTLAGNYRRTTLLGAEISLPGPTGERNLLRFAARGAVLCAAGSAEVLLNQLAATVATGNRAIVLGDANDLMPDGLPLEVADRMVFLPDLAACDCDLQVALVDPRLAPALRPALAERDGPVTAVIETGDSAPIPIWRLVAERALCVNTTAAGGNASLMTLGL